MGYDKNLVHYVSATVIIVNKERRFLIVKRAEWEKAFAGRWTVPGGKMKVLDYALREKDSKYQWYNVAEDLCKGECAEEVGFDIKNINYVTSLVYVRPDNVPVLVLSFWASRRRIILKLFLIRVLWTINGLVLRKRGVMI